MTNVKQLNTDVIRNEVPSHGAANYILVGQLNNIQLPLYESQYIGRSNYPQSRLMDHLKEGLSTHFIIKKAEIISELYINVTTVKNIKPKIT